MRVTQHPILDELDTSKTVTIYFDGKPVEALEGEPIAAALINAGIRSFRTTAKRHEPVSYTHLVPKETLITKVWGYDSNAEANNVEAYISFLRKKLIYLDSCVSIITLRKVGYRLEGGEA